MPYVSASPSKSRWLETIAGISMLSAPVRRRKSRSFRQWPNLDTMIRVRVGVAASVMVQVMPWASATGPNR